MKTKEEHQVAPSVKDGKNSSADQYAYLVCFICGFIC